MPAPDCHGCGICDRCERELATAKRAAEYWQSRCNSAEGALEALGGELAVQHFSAWRTEAGGEDTDGSVR